MKTPEQQTEPKNKPENLVEIGALCTLAFVICCMVAGLIIEFIRSII